MPKFISLWRNEPPKSVPSGSANFNSNFIFPSGRQALSFCLKKLGMSRENQVAVPEWSSQCVIAAVGAYATPIATSQVLEHGIQPDAILLYEQWGWPAPPGCIEKVRQEFGCPIILDKVDSPILESTKDAAAEIWSLSKTLGLSGGGMAKIGGKYLEFRENQSHMAAYNALASKEIELHISHILKTEVAVVPSNVKQFVAKNGVEQPFGQERKARRENLALLLGSPLAKGYPDWMPAAHKQGAAPGIFPLCMEKEEKFLASEKKRLEKLGILTEIYHFNFSGDPLVPEYEKCLAFPIHGMMDKKQIASALRI